MDEPDKKAAENNEPKAAIEQQPASTNYQNISSGRQHAPKIQTFREWLNTLSNISMVIVTVCLVILAMKQWQVMNDSLEETKKMNTETKDLTTKTIEYANQQADAAQKAAASAKVSADAAKETAQISERLSKTTYQQFILSAEPNIHLETVAFANRVEAGKIKFELRNLSPVKLIKVRCYSGYYEHLINKDLKEHLLTWGNMNTLKPDIEIKSIDGNSTISVEFDFGRSGLTNTDKSMFYLGSPPKGYFYKDIEKIRNATFAEYKIEFQRELDGKHFSQRFYYLIIPPHGSDVYLIRQSKEDIINENKQFSILWKSMFDK